MRSPTERTEQSSSVDAVADQVVRRLQPATVLHVGCGTGSLVEALAARGVDARGFDCAEQAISQAAEPVRDRVWVSALTDQVEGRFDLVVCLDAIQHVAAADAGLALERVTSVTDSVLLASSPEEFDDPANRNVRPPEYWAELLATLGFFRDPAFDASFAGPWAALYRRRGDVAVPELVRDLERESWQVRRERDRLREVVLAASSGDLGPSDALAEVQAVAEHLRHDLRVAVDAVREAQAERATVAAELARTRNELRVAEEREKEFVDLVARIDLDAAESRRAYEDLLASRSFRTFTALLAPYRRLRARR